VVVAAKAAAFDKMAQLYCRDIHSIGHPYGMGRERGVGNFLGYLSCTRANVRHP